MKRSPLTANPDTTRAWQQRSRARAAGRPGRAPGSTLAAKSPRGVIADRALARAYREVDRRDAGACQYVLLDATHRCPWPPGIEHDHLWGRRVEPGRRATPWAIVSLCRDAHHRVTTDPNLHRQLRTVVLVERIVEFIAGANMPPEA